MRRVLFAVAVLLTTTASPAFAGYIIIRVLLEGNGGGTAPGGPKGGGPGYGMPGSPKGGTPDGFQLGSGYGSKQGSGMSGKPAMSGPKSGGTTSTPADESDHTRAVVVVVPLETDLLHGRLDTNKLYHKDNNPDYPKFVAPFYGRRLQGTLFIDSSSIQLYKELIDKPGPKKTRTTEIRDKYLAWAKGKSEPQLLYDAMILALESGVIRDTYLHKDGSPPNDATTFAQELLGVAAEKKLTLPTDVQRFVTAWEPIHKAVKAPAPQLSNAEHWRAVLNATAVRSDGHYSLIYWDSPEPEVFRRSTQLNDNFTAFFMWHATRGVSMPVPEKSLVVVLAADIDQVAHLRFGLDGLVPHADAFYAPDHNIVVLAPQRLDGVGQTFLRQTNHLFSKGLNRDELTAGKFPKLDSTGEKGSKPDEVARATTFAVVEKLVLDEAELAAVSREGSNQLLFTTGLLPKNVTLPNWLTQGAANFYTRPRGPAYVTKGDDDKPYMTVSFSTGYGIPNYVLQRSFNEMGDVFHKELNPDPAKLLENVLTDAYFNGLKEAIDPDPPGKVKKHHGTGGHPGSGGPGIPPKRPMGPESGSGSGAMKPGGPGMMYGPGGSVATDSAHTEDPTITQRKKRERLATKAQATAWALYYYLARSRPAELKQYVAELNKLPRDLPIDGRTAHSAFVRVFKLSKTEDGQADPALLKKFAKEWLDYMATVPVVGIDVPLVEPELPKTPNPMGGPGGSSPGPGMKPGSSGKGPNG